MSQVELPALEFAAEFQSGYRLKPLEKVTKTPRIYSRETFI
jgi:hypothetical protein